VIVIFLLLFCFFSTTSPALALTVKDTLSTSQLSYFARLGVGNSEGSTILNIATSANPSINTNNLFVDDVIGIGRSNSNGLDLYTVKDISNATSLIIDPSLALTNATDGNIIIAT